MADGLQLHRYNDNVLANECVSDWVGLPTHIMNLRETYRYSNLKLPMPWSVKKCFSRAGSHTATLL